MRTNKLLTCALVGMLSIGSLHANNSYLQRKKTELEKIRIERTALSGPNDQYKFFENQDSLARGLKKELRAKLAEKDLKAHGLTGEFFASFADIISQLSGYEDTAKYENYKKMGVAAFADAIYDFKKYENGKQIAKEFIQCFAEGGYFSYYFVKDPEIVSLQLLKLTDTLFSDPRTASKNLPRFKQILADVDGREEIMKKFVDGAVSNFLGIEDTYFVGLALACSNVCKQATDSAKNAELARMKAVFDGYGISDYQRFTPKILENIYFTATDSSYSTGVRHSEKYGKDYPVKLALVPASVGKWFGDREDDKKYITPHLEELIDRGYNLVMFEEPNKKLFGTRLKNYGTLEKPAEIAASFKKFDLMFMIAHGSWNSISLSHSKTRSGMISVGDFRSKNFKEGSWSSIFNPNATIILHICSAGAELKNSRTYNHVKNIADMVARLARGVGVFAPQKGTSESKFTFDGEGRVEDVYYSRGDIFGSESGTNYYKYDAY